MDGVLMVCAIFHITARTLGITELDLQSPSSLAALVAQRLGCGSWLPVHARDVFDVAPLIMAANLYESTLLSGVCWRLKTLVWQCLHFKDNIYTNLTIIFFIVHYLAMSNIKNI
jgi:hypothetical protein